MQAVGNFIVEDLKPISLVEGKGFCKLMNVAEPRFNVPSWTYFSQSVISAKYIELREEVETLSSTVHFCTITTDLWTAKYQTRGYISSTCHGADSITLSTIELTANLTAPTISSALMESMSQCMAHQDNVVGNTTDNARNISNAME